MTKTAAGSHGEAPKLTWNSQVLSHGSLIQEHHLPSGKLTFSYGKSPFLMGKLTINGHFQ